MNKTAKRFLLWSFPVSYLCFGALLVLGGGSRLLAGLLLVLGAAGPVLGGLLAGGRAALPTEGRAWGLAGLLLALYLVLTALLRVVAPAQAPRLGVLVPAAVLLGAQALGWQGVLLPALAESRPRWKATAATGLIWSLWFLPLLFLPGSAVGPELFLPFAVWLTGLAFLQELVARQGGAALAAVFGGVYFLLAGLLPVTGPNGWYLAGALGILLAALYGGTLGKKPS